MKCHLHKYKFESRTANGHTHRLLGYAGNMFGINSLHFHFYYGISSYNQHTHYFCGITGLPVKTENGHIHRMEGILENNCLHDHKYSGYTFEDIAYFTSRQAVSFER